MNAFSDANLILDWERLRELFRLKIIKSPPVALSVIPTTRSFTISSKRKSDKKSVHRFGRFSGDSSLFWSLFAYLHPLWRLSEVKNGFPWTAHNPEIMLRARPPPVADEGSARREKIRSFKWVPAPARKRLICEANPFSTVGSNPCGSREWITARRKKITPSQKIIRRLAAVSEQT